MKIISRKDAIKKKLKFYFTNKTCKYGHVELRRVDNCACIICYKAIKARSDKKYSQNPKTKKIRKAIYARYRKTKKYKNAQKKYRESEKSKETQKEYRQSEKAIWYRRNIGSKSPKKKITDYNYRQSLKGKLKRRARENRPENVEKKIKYRKNTEAGQRFSMWGAVRTRLKGWIKNKDGKKIERNKMEEIVGCSREELRNYLEKKFKPGMTWLNHSRYGWHIDHIIPLSKFDPNKYEDIKKANHYTNLQPLWAEENLKKNNK